MGNSSAVTAEEVWFGRCWVAAEGSSLLEVITTGVTPGELATEETPCKVIFVLNSPFWCFPLLPVPLQPARNLHDYLGSRKHCTVMPKVCESDKLPSNKPGSITLSSKLT